ncbi:Uu.00g073170.m01.CDS01 [Anthostomella pinea]|uniref:protein-tyrosine-phosphatase n=1 Tax=Anthostomella pinea TaxID=933095 RepID=A0AAI8VV82_9PEZI|nr:Uu.00g073170.m01.CDS01 [Anthostomella pinea]
MSSMSRIPGDANLFVGGLWILNIESYRNHLYDNNITHVLSLIKWSFDKWSEEGKRFKHMSIDIDDLEESDLLSHLPAAVRFIDSGLYPPQSVADGTKSSDNTPTTAQDGATSPPPSPGGVYVHCVMGKSRSVSCVVAYLLYKYPHRFGGRPFVPSAAATSQRRETAKEAVQKALDCVREVRSHAEPNDGFMEQLELWWEMGCPAEDDGAVERHPTYQKWLYDRMLKDARDMHMAPEADHIRFGDEVDQPTTAGGGPEAQEQGGNEVRCKKCRRMLATPKFLVPHAPVGEAQSGHCAHIFIDTLSWMRPMLEDGALDGRLICPNSKCGATVGRFAWQGLKCSCREWVVPAFSLNRSRVDEVAPRPDGGGRRGVSGQSGNL